MDTRQSTADPKAVQQRHPALPSMELSHAVTCATPQGSRKPSRMRCVESIPLAERDVEIERLSLSQQFHVDSLPGFERKHQRAEGLIVRNGFAGELQHRVPRAHADPVCR